MTGPSYDQWMAKRILVFADHPWLAARMWEQMLTAESQFGSTDTYFWEKHGHAEFMREARQILEGYGCDE